MGAYEDMKVMFLESAKNEAGFGIGRAHQAWAENWAFSFITSYRYNKTDAENQATFRSLMSDLRSNGMGYKKVFGSWKNDDGSVGQEPSLYITKAPRDMSYEAYRDIIMQLGAKYEQDAVLINNPERGLAEMICTTPHTDWEGKSWSVGQIMMEFPHFSPQSIGDYWTALKKSGHPNGRNFTLHNIPTTPEPSAVPATVQQ